MKNVLTIMALGILALSACTKENTTPTEETKPEQIRITTGFDINRLTKSAITDGIFPTTRDMFVAAYHGSSSQVHFPQTRFSYSSGAWVADKSWPLSGALDFLAYSPGTASLSNVVWGTPDVTSSIQFTMGDNSSLQEDILVGCAPSQTTRNNIVIDFKHPQAYLTFTGKSSPAYNATTNRGITINSITLKSAKYSGTVLSTRNAGNLSFFWSSLGSAKTLAVPGLSSTNLGTSASVLGKGILLPEQSEVGFNINYTLHNGKDASGNAVNTTLNYDYTPSSPCTWESGKKYTYGIDISLNGVGVTPSVASWTDGGNKEVKL